MLQGDAIPYVAGWLGVAFLLRRLLGSWLMPPVYCTTLWGLLAVVNLWQDKFIMEPSGLLYEIVVCLTFGLGHLFGSGLTSNPNLVRAHLTNRRSYLFPYLRSLLAASGILGLAWPVVIGANPAMDVNQAPLYLQPLLIAHFLGPIVAGLALGFRCLPGANRYYAAVAMLGPLVTSIGFGGRTALIGPLLLFLTAYLLTHITTRLKRTKLITFKRIAYSVALAAILLVYASAVYTIRIIRARDNIQSAYQAQNLWQDITDLSQVEASYSSNVEVQAVGQVGMFTQMFSSRWADPGFQPRWGTFIFSGPVRLLGWDGADNLPEYDLGKGRSSNVYTIFPAPLEDFGLYGSFICWLIVGMVSGSAWERARQGRVTGIMLTLFVTMNIQVGTSYLMRYNSVILMYVLCYGYAALVDHMRERGRSSIRSAHDRPGHPMLILRPF